VSIPYLGTQKTCNCCGWRLRSFKHYRPPYAPDTERVICPHCRSLERHRWLWLWLAEHTDLQHTPMRILHFAQEYALYRLFRRLPHLRVIGTDIRFQDRVDVQEDMTRLAFAAACFDAIICNHVLEHVPDDGAAMREMVRVLKPGGWAIVTTPVRLNQSTYEDDSITDPRQREQVFGQHDHVRYYGYDIVDRLQAAGFHVTTLYAQDVSAEVRKQYGIGASGIMFFCVKPDEAGL
jgi:SAM-dependent methyltransferase